MTTFLTLGLLTESKVTSDPDPYQSQDPDPDPDPHQNDTDPKHWK